MADLSKARRAADAFRQSVAGGRSRVTIEADADSVRALLKIVDAVPFPGAELSGNDDEISPREAADILRMSRPSVMRLIALGRLHPRMVLSRHKLSRAEVLDYRDKQTRERREALAGLSRLSEEHDF
jgi:hypothetical protein